MPSRNKQPQIPLPKSWGTQVRFATLRVIALAQYPLAYNRSCSTDIAYQPVGNLVWCSHSAPSGEAAKSSRSRSIGPRF